MYVSDAPSLVGPSWSTPGDAHPETKCRYELSTGDPTSSPACYDYKADQLNLVPLGHTKTHQKTLKTPKNT
jgi:hypothetical protein